MFVLSAGPSRYGWPEAGLTAAHWMLEASVGVMCMVNGTL